MNLKVGDKVRIKPLVKDMRHWWGKVGTITVICPEMPPEFEFPPITVEILGVGVSWCWRDELELIESNPLEQRGE